MFRLFLILDTGSIHPEALNWAARVAANGGTVSDSTLKAVSDFCKETASIRSLFLRLNLFAGNNLNAALVPLYLGEAPGIVYGNAVDTNFNFVAGDYTERGTNGGLIGNGVNKYLDTGFIPNSVAAFGLDNASISVYINNNIAANTNDIGTRTLATNLSSIGVFTASNNISSGINSSALNTAVANSLGHTFIRRNNSTNQGVFKNGVLLASPASSSTSKSTVSHFIFARNFSGTPEGYTTRRQNAYHIGASFTQAQVSLFYNALQKFQTALNRQV